VYQTGPGVPGHRGAYVPEAAFYGFGPHLLLDSTGTQVAVLLMQAKFVRSVNIGEQVLRRGIENPLQAVQTVNRLQQVLQTHGFSLELSTDMAGFMDCRGKTRGGVPSPMFDHEISDLRGKAFWLCLQDETGEVVALQACRLDFVDTSLAEWASGWMSGLYMKRDLIMSPKRHTPYHQSRSYEVTGWLTYHGELWLSEKSKRGSGAASAFCLLGMVLAHIKWQPDAIWALIENRLAIAGHPIRFGYPTIERSFLNWAWSPDDVPSNEWLLLAESADMERIVTEYHEVGPIVP
jgi:hypothetical protein